MSSNSAEATSTDDEASVIKDLDNPTERKKAFRLNVVNNTYILFGKLKALRPDAHVVVGFTLSTNQKAPTFSATVSGTGNDRLLWSTQKRNTTMEIIEDFHSFLKTKEALERG